jgi:hypothetical protein
MPIFIEWKWVERTKTFLAIFHFWDDGKKGNLRMTKEKEYSAFETCVYVDEGEKKDEFLDVITVPGGRLDSRTGAYLTWAPSHPEFCLLTEILTYANLINGMKTNEKERLRPMLQGKAEKYEVEGKRYTSFQISSELLGLTNSGKAVTFSQSEGISFEVCLEYIEYLRDLLRRCF